MTAEEMMKKVSENLEEHHWHFSTKKCDDGDCAIDTDICSKSGLFCSYDIRFLFREWDMQAIYYIPIKAPENVRKEVAEYFCRINWRLKYGEFVIDFEDGELRCLFLVNPAGVAADVEDVISDCFRISKTIDNYASGLMSVIAGGKSAADAFADATKLMDAPPQPPPAEGVPAASTPPPSEGQSPESEPPQAVFADDLLAEPEDGKATTRHRGKKTSKKAKKAADGDAAGTAGARNYSLEGLNIQGKISLEKIVDAVMKFKRGKKNPDVDTPRLNILLSGAPGSGKTAFVKYLARKVGMPLRTIRASNLLSRYSGDTEQKIAESFRRAKENGEMLFLDEIDSFLQNRKNASRSWEVTQVNELLQQMEAFGGVMVGATNFAEHLDKAVLRRFTYKLKLDYLTAEGKGVFFKRYFKTPLTAEEQTRLNAIANLTPGDFRTVHEELFYLSDKQTNAERLDALEAESAAKGAVRAKIGF